jgi:hypothetical protein|tara:strand:+ start:86 stop:484 length:399 start_codon:yes stop_codon:yes gene_type:complete
MKWLKTSISTKPLCDALGIEWDSEFITVTKEELEKEGMTLDENGRDMTHFWYGKKGETPSPDVIAKRLASMDIEAMKKKNSESLKKYWETADRSKHSKIMKRVSKGRKSPNPEGHKNGWETRRAKYGPTGRS